MSIAQALIPPGVLFLEVLWVVDDFLEFGDFSLDFFSARDFFQLLWFRFANITWKSTNFSQNHFSQHGDILAVPEANLAAKFSISLSFFLKFLSFLAESVVSGGGPLLLFMAWWWDVDKVDWLWFSEVPWWFVPFVVDFFFFFVFAWNYGKFCILMSRRQKSLFSQGLISP